MLLRTIDSVFPTAVGMSALCLLIVQLSTRCAHIPSDLLLVFCRVHSIRFNSIDEFQLRHPKDTRRPDLPRALCVITSHNAGDKFRRGNNPQLSDKQFLAY